MRQHPSAGEDVDVDVARTVAEGEGGAVEARDAAAPLPAPHQSR